MDKKTGYLIIGIGIASIAAGIFAGFRTGALMDSLSGIVIGASLIATAIFQDYKRESE